MPRLRSFASQATAVEVLTYALIVVSPLTVYRVKIGVNVSPQRAILLLLVVALCAQFLRRERRLPHLTRPVVVALGTLLVFFVYELAQFGRTEQTDFSGRFLGGFAAGIVIIGVLVVAIDSTRVLWGAIVAFLASAVVPIALGLYQLAGVSLGFVPTLPLAGLLSTDQLFLANFTTEVDGLAVPRIPSTLAAPAFFGEYLALVAIAGLAWLLLAGERRVNRVLPVVALVVLAVVNLVATFARSAWLIFGIGLLMVAFHARAHLVSALFGKGRRWLVPTIAAACLATLPILPFPVDDAISGALQSVDLRDDASPAVIEQRFAGEVLTLNPSVDVNSTAASTLTHLNLRENALELFAEHPLTGVGLGNYGVRTQQPAGVSSAQAYGFTVLAEGGAIGFALFTLMLIALVYAARSAYRSRRPDSPLGAVLLGLYVMVLLLVLNNLVLYDTLYRDTSFVVVALAIAAANVVCRGSGADGGRHVLENR